MQPENVLAEVERLRNEMTQALIELIRIPAISPQNGGEGEQRKAEKLMQILEGARFDKIERYDAADEAAYLKKRPNIIASYEGEEDTEKLWVITHLDIVPPGQESLWTISRPFEPTTDGEKIYGRGSEDNGQSLIASIFAAKALMNLGIKPKRTMDLAFVADEEQESTYGIQHLIGQGLFKKSDLIIVPDGGNETGTFIEVAEKSVLWLKIRTVGMQAHASRPGKGLNAHRVGMSFALTLDKMLHEKYAFEDKYFDPPVSTFEPTIKDKNVDAVNIIPGEDIIYFDCRILPNYSLDEMLSNIQRLAEEFREKTRAGILVELVRKSVAPTPTSTKAPIVLMLENAIEKVRGTEPRVGGIGGGTCASFFRKINIPAVVWSTTDETAHQPNEYAKIENLVNDAKVYAFLAMT